MIETVSNCSCKPQDEFPTGGSPEYYQTEKEAQEAFQAHQARYRSDPWHRYWAVHVRGRHVIAT